MIGRIAAQMLDPYFVREEELAAVMARKTSLYSKLVRVRQFGLTGTYYPFPAVPVGKIYRIVGVQVNNYIGASANIVIPTLSYWDPQGTQGLLIYGEQITAGDTFTVCWMDDAPTINNRIAAAAATWQINPNPQFLMEEGWNFSVNLTGDAAKTFEVYLYYNIYNLEV